MFFRAFSDLTGTSHYEESSEQTLYDPDNSIQHTVKLWIYRMNTPRRFKRPRLNPKFMPSSSLRFQAQFYLKGSSLSFGEGRCRRQMGEVLLRMIYLLRRLIDLRLVKGHELRLLISIELHLVGVVRAARLVRRAIWRHRMHLRTILGKADQHDV